MLKFMQRSAMSRNNAAQQSSTPRGATLRRLAGDERGSVALWVGLALITFVGCAGMAIDTARGYMMKARLSQALDAAALAGAKSLLSDTRDADINMFFNANFDAGSFSATVSGPVIVADTQKNTVSVSATATIDTTLMFVLGFDTMTVGAQSKAIRAINGLDVVVSMDMSLSMELPATKIQGAVDAAKIMVDTLYNDPNPKVVTINGQNYDLLNIGMVPWNGKINVRTNTVIDNTPFSTAATQTITVPSYTNPVTGATNQIYVYKSNISEVLLLSPPPSGWTGGVYARYIQDTSLTNDADLTLGYGAVGGKDWVAYEPIPPLEGEPQSGTWNNTTGGKPGATNWNGKEKMCKGAYWNDNLVDPDRPIDVGNQPAWWKDKRINPAEDCLATLTHGIVPLMGVKDATTKGKITTAINNLNTGGGPDGNTNVPQGLFWAWEVLMPGAPFNQAKVSVPFKRTQAIVLLSDGANTGYNGDAYKAVFGHKESAGTTTGNGTLPNGKPNNMNNRLLELAAKIKGANPAQGVKIFVVQYEESDPALKTLLKQVATEPNAPYYFFAPGATELKNAFKQIAAALSVLRLEQ